MNREKKKIRNRQAKDKALLWAVCLLAALTSVPLLAILGEVLLRGYDQLSWSFLTEPTPTAYRAMKAIEAGEPIAGGIANGIVGTMLMLGMAAAAAIPTGILCGAFLAENAKSRFAQIVSYLTDLLQGTPSVIIGIVVYIWVVVPMKGYSAIAGSAALCIMMLPLIVRSAEETLKILPASLKEAGLALGGNSARVMLKVQLPAAIGGIFTGVLLAVSRVIGETAPPHVYRAWLLIHPLRNRQTHISSASAYLGILQRPQSSRTDMGRITLPVIIRSHIKPYSQTTCKEMETVTPILQFNKTCVSYTKQTMAVKYVSAAIQPNTITAIMGPSGCGKSTLLRAVNLMHSLYPNIRVDGEILLNGENILSMDPIDVRRRAGMVFQRPAPFPTMSIRDNVLSGYALNGIRLSKTEKDETVERCLKSVALWDEVKDVLNKKGTFLSGGQQQRLCIARALAMKPDILLMDEPTSALDPIATAHIEQLMQELQKEVTILIVTHNMGQARRIASKSMFMYLGELVEYGDTETMFTSPTDRRTKAYLTGKMG